MGRKALLHWERSWTLVSYQCSLFCCLDQNICEPWPCERFVQRINIGSSSHFERGTQLPQHEVDKHTVTTGVVRQDQQSKQSYASTILPPVAKFIPPLHFPSLSCPKWAQIIPVCLVHRGVWRGTLSYLWYFDFKGHQKRAFIETGVGGRNLGWAR